MGVDKALHAHLVQIEGVGSYLTTASDGEPHSHELSASVVEDIRAAAAGTSLGDALEGVDAPLLLSESQSGVDHVHRLRIGDLEITSGGPEAVTPTVQLSVPHVLTYEAVRSGELPDLGQSGIPTSLEGDVPARFRYWQAADVDRALRVRRALVESGLFSDGSVLFVDGVPRRVVRSGAEMYVPDGDADGYLVDPQFGPPSVLASALAGLPADAGVVSASAGALVSSAELVSRVIRYDVDALVEFPRGGETEAAFVSAGFGPCCWEIPSVPDVGYFSTRLPAEDSVWWLDEPPSGVLELYLRHRTAEGSPSSDGLLGWLRTALAEPTARLAHLARTLIEMEMSAEGREEFLQALGWEAVRVTKREFHPVTKREGPKRIVWGIVLQPGIADLGGDLIGSDDPAKAADEIAELAWDYMEFSQTPGLEHTRGIDGRAAIVESYLAPQDIELGGRPVPEGAWVMALRIRDDTVWEMIERGELTGFSIGGYGYRTKLK